MWTFKGNANTADELKSVRLRTSTQSSVKETINAAVSLNDVNDSSFVGSVDCNAVQSTIGAHKITVIESDADRKAFFDALDNPPEPTDQLINAFALRKKLIANAE